MVARRWIGVAMVGLSAIACETPWGKRERQREESLQAMQDKRDRELANLDAELAANVREPYPWETVAVPFPFVPIADFVKDITVTAADAVPMEVIDIREVHTPTFSKGTLGEPRELLRAKHLRLSDEVPVATNRGMVEITDGVGYEATTVEAVLVDFETGEVARFADAFRTNPGLGIVWGQDRGPDGELRSIAVHPDGLAVPWVAEGTVKQRTDMVVNVGRKEVLLFRQNRDWHENREGTTFARWTDLRKPPQPPTHPLPIPPGGGDSDQGLYGRYASDRDGVVLNVTASTGRGTDGCQRVEILPDNTTRCIPRGDLILGDDWHITAGEDEWIAYNEARREIQRLRFGCPEGDGIDVLSSDAPPRLEIHCRRQESVTIWSPEQTVRARSGENGIGDHSNRSSLGTHRWWRATEGWKVGAERYTAVLDTAQQRELEVGCVELSSLNAQPDRVAVRDCATGDFLIADLAEAKLLRLASRGSCAELTHWEAAGPMWIYRCRNAAGSTKWTEVVDLHAMRKWRFTTVGAGRAYRWVWLQADPAMLVSVDERGPVDRLVAWDLN